jgi:UDP-3-O-[3-hydroxymyristoyl] N-acetylglucosamine deacetylase
MRLLPAPPGSGVRFRRTDRRAAGIEIAASWRNVVTAPLCTMLSDGAGTNVRTIEHLMCALYACDIDNVLVELDSEELPILDGSAAPLVQLIDAAGTAEQVAPRRFIRVLRPVAVAEGKTRLELQPAEEFAIDVTLAMPDFGLLRWSGEATPAVVRREIAPARTFGRLKEALPALLLGRFGGPPLLRGASFTNALLVHGRRVLNRGGLRLSDEFVRHRVLDAIGDLALAGAPLLGRFTAVRTSHRFNRRLLVALFDDESAWCWTAGETSAKAAAG